MKLKVYIQCKHPAMMPKIIKKGDWIDLKSAIDINYSNPQASSRKRVTENGVTTSYRDVELKDIMIPLGVAMKLPDGFEAHLLPRSSSYTKYGIMLTNSMGIIDNSYCGPNDEWCFHAVVLNKGAIKFGDRIGQFRIELSQKATFLQKVKWLLCNEIELIEVLTLDAPNRGGFGTTK